DVAPVLEIGGLHGVDPVPAPAVRQQGGDPVGQQGVRHAGHPFKAERQAGGGSGFRHPPQHGIHHGGGAEFSRHALPKRQPFRRHGGVEQKRVEIHVQGFGGAFGPFGQRRFQI